MLASPVFHFGTQIIIPSLDTQWYQLFHPALGRKVITYNPPRIKLILH